jgi:hypothetical protein
MNEGTHSGKSTICLLGISAERPTNGLYLYLFRGSEKLVTNFKSDILSFYFTIMNTH